MVDVIENTRNAPAHAPDLPTGRQASRDFSGTGYERPKPSYNEELMRVGRGTPMGEYLRRYWHPVAISRDVTDLPIRVRIMGEDLVVFRDKKGRPGAVYERCVHRQASLFYGRVEEEGIRCCYHGWMFDVEGHCLNQPLETNGGRCGAVRQPWYPVEEVYGLIFIYMGPPDKMPLVPRYDCMEDLGEDEYYTWTFDSLPGSTGHIVPYSWMLNMDNIHDMGHALWLHELHSGAQFGPAFSYITMDNIAHHQNAYKYVENEHGIHSIDEVRLGDIVVKSSLETQMPNVRMIHPAILPGPSRMVDWAVPVDDEHHYDISLVRVRRGELDLSRNPMAHWDRSDPETVQRQPTDHEAQMGQGPIPWHSEEHLVNSDRGLVKMRRQYMSQLKAMAEGRPLMNQRFGDENPILHVEAGAFFPEGYKSAADLTAGPISAPTVDAGGSWALTMKTPMGDQKTSADFSQAGSALSGSMTMPDASVVTITDGTVSGDRVTWKVSITQPFDMTMAFDVVIEGQTLSGKCQPGVFPASDILGERA